MLAGDVDLPELIGEAFAHIADSVNVTSEGSLADSGSTLLNNPQKVDVFRFGDTVYAFVTSAGEDGVQAISLADPSSPAATSNVPDSNWRQMQSAYDIELFVHEGRNLLGVVTGYFDGTHSTPPICLGDAILPHNQTSVHWQ